MCRLPVAATPAQSSRIKARATEAAQLKKVAEASSAKQVETELASFDVEASPTSSKKAAGGSAKSDPDTDVSASTGTSDSKGVTAATRSKMHKVGSMEGVPPGPAEDSLAKGTEGKTSHLAAVAVCVTGAVMSSMLQFSFVYGEIRFQK